MRTLFSIASCLVLGAAAARPLLAEGPAAPPPAPKLEFVYVEMSGVEGAEVAAAADALGGIPGVRSFAWTTAGAEAKVVREAGKAANETLFTAARNAGAATAGVVPILSTSYTFEKKLHCGGCVAQVNKALKAVKGVKESWVPKDMTTVTVISDSRVTKSADVVAALAAIGKPVLPPSQ